MRILVTGASGFIGRAVRAVAIDRGHAVLRFQRASDEGGAATDLVLGTLADPPLDAIAAFEPDAVLHLAWISTPGEYLTSAANADLLRESVAFLTQCQELGVQHIAAAGTCIEYAPSKQRLHELRSALDASTPYSKAKAGLRDWLAGVSVGRDRAWTWFRIFYPFGPGEHPARLPSLVVRSIASGEPIELQSPRSVKDYIFIEDVARAICMALEERLVGPVNIGTGDGVAVRSLAETIARLMHADPRLIRDADTLSRDPWPVQVADAGRLTSIGWRADVGLECGLERLIAAQASLPIASTSMN